MQPGDPIMDRPLDATSAGTVLPSHARAVVIGGGVVGCSVLFHLAKFGWKDSVLLERAEITSGSSWHAAGQIHTISSDPNISRLQGYTIRLYKEIEATSGQSVGMHNTGGFYLASNEVWHDYLKRERSKARSMGLDQEFISLEEVARRHPLIDPAHYVAALWDPLDGDIDPSGVCHAYAKSARILGAQVFTHTPVLETCRLPDGGWSVVTPKGTIRAEHIVNAAGLWAREVGRLAGIELPVQPMEHHYLITEEIPEIAERMQDGQRLPGGIDYEANIYFRQERTGLLLGTYEPKATPWAVAGTPADFGHELLPSDLDRIADRIELAFGRIPALGRAGIKTVVNGPFTFGPDGNPIIGPVPGLSNYWVAVGVMAGFCQAGGVGKCLAEWMTEGEPEIDVWAMDIARFGPFATPDWGTVKAAENYERRFVMTFPNETLPRGRRQKTTALYDRLVARGAVMGVSFGLEHALWFANGPDDAHEAPTFGRNRSHPYVAREVAAVRQAVGMIEIANFGKHLVEGPGARAFLDHLLAGRLPAPGRTALSPMLTPRGRLYGDLTVTCLAEDRFLLLGSGVMQEAHRRWFACHMPADGSVRHVNVSDSLHGVGIAGPNARRLLERITRTDVSVSAFRFRDARETVVAGVPATLIRISFSGELGYEIYVAPQHQLRLWEGIEAAGTDLDLRPYGARAQMSLRLEKGWGVWTLDYRPDHTAAESGLDGFIDWSKDFVGKSAALAERERGPVRRLVTLIVDTEREVVGDEAVINAGTCVGHVTSGGYAHTCGVSVALAYVRAELAVEGTALAVEINGEMRPARVAAEPLYDPSGARMRA
jgi:dimethylglycine dehydrogenase